MNEQDIARLIEERDWARKQLVAVVVALDFPLPECISENPEFCVDEACPACIPPFEEQLPNLFEIYVRIQHLKAK